MTVLTLAVLFRTLQKYDITWTGVGSAWLIACFVDAMLYAWLGYCIFQPPICE